MTCAIVTRDAARAAARLRAGGVVAFPTETVYGLGADATQVEAVRRVFAVKGRPPGHPLIVHIGDGAQLDDWARDIPAPAYRLAERFWPGPLTLILRRRSRVPDAVTGGQDSVGLRVPGHPLARALLAAFGGGIAAPSANRFGRVSATTGEHVRAELGDAIDLILDGGPCPVGIESTIVSFTDGEPVLLRPGAIAPSALAAVLGSATVAPATGVVRAPGRHAVHYAPATALLLAAPAALWPEVARVAGAGRRVVVLARTPAPVARPPGVVLLAMPAHPEDYARGLYDALRRADAMGADRLLVESPPAEEAWLAIHDRLRRAATGTGAHALWCG